MDTQTFRVLGLSCDHCVQAVTSEVGQLSGVQSVQVDLSSNLMTVVSSHPIDRASVAAALDDAGYELAP